MADWGAIFSAIAAVGAAVSAGCSLLQQMNAKRSAANLRKIDNNTLWYNKIALDTIITHLNQIIDRTERNIDICKSNKRGSAEFSERLKEINDELTSDINSLNELLVLLKIFDIDLFKKCSSKLEEIRDIYSAVINESLVQRYIVFYKVNDIHRKKKEIVGELWRYAKIVTEE